MELYSNTATMIVNLTLISIPSVNQGTTIAERGQFALRRARIQDFEVKNKHLSSFESSRWTENCK